MNNDTRKHQVPIGLPRRLGAIVYDLLLLFAILLVASVPWVVSGVRQGQPGYVIYVVFVYTLIPLYYIGFWAYSGQTLGMKTWRMRVVTLDGYAIGWQRASLRMFCAILSTAAFGLGFVHSFFDKQNRAWHDILSKSQLIDLSSLAAKNPAVKKK